MDLWLDTSIVLRLVTKQPKELYEAARALLERAEIARTSGAGVAAFDWDYARLGVAWVNPARQM